MHASVVSLLQWAYKPAWRFCSAGQTQQPSVCRRLSRVTCRACSRTVGAFACRARSARVTRAPRDAQEHMPFRVKLSVLLGIAARSSPSPPYTPPTEGAASPVPV